MNFPEIADQNGPVSNGNEEVLYIPLIPKLEPQHQFNLIERTLKNLKYCYLILIISFKINHLFAHS